MNAALDKALSANILIVDDKPDNVSLLEMMLSFSGYTNVQSTTDPREVEGLYQDNDFDIILLDIRMPHMDGFQVMERLSHIVKGDYLPILILTAQNDMDTRLKALEAGARDFVTKPFDKMEVLNRIHNMLEVRFLYKERLQQNDILESKVKKRTLELQNRNEELARTRLDIIRRLGRAGEYRDNETGMHDVGKIGIPDAVLLKPGKLAPDEFDIIKTHSEIGGDIIGEHQSDLMQMARTIALTHHEKWDGSGYPNGLKGEDIPIEGRIAAVCDVFDALTSSRPYKTGWPVDKAMAFINEQSGAHFDPELVRLFNAVLPDILDIRKAYVDPT